MDWKNIVHHACVEAYVKRCHRVAKAEGMTHDQFTVNQPNCELSGWIDARIGKDVYVLRNVTGT